MRRVLLALALLGCVGTVGATRRPTTSSSAVTSPTRDTLRVGRTTLSVEIADTDSLRTRGLSGRMSMGWNEGMLFVFPEAERRAFWMIDCHYDLDIAYIAPDGTIRDIQTMLIEPGVAPRDLARYPSRTSDIMYALELSRGWFASNGIQVGYRIPGVLRHRTRQ